LWTRYLEGVRDVADVAVKPDSEHPVRRHSRSSKLASDEGLARGFAPRVVLQCSRPSRDACMSPTRAPPAHPPPSLASSARRHAVRPIWALGGAGRLGRRAAWPDLQAGVDDMSTTHASWSARTFAEGLEITALRGRPHLPRNARFRMHEFGHRGSTAECGDTGTWRTRSRRSNRALPGARFRTPRPELRSRRLRHFEDVL